MEEQKIVAVPKAINKKNPMPASAEPGGGVKRKANSQKQPKTSKRAKTEVGSKPVKKSSKPKKKTDSKKVDGKASTKKKVSKGKAKTADAEVNKKKSSKPKKNDDVAIKRKKSRQGRAVDDVQRKAKGKKEVVSSDDEDMEEKKKVYNRTKKIKRRKLKKHDEMPVYIVDEHDGSMVAMLRAIETGYLPTTGIKLMHFDSHPDLGNIPDKWDGFDGCHEQNYSIRELYDTTDIATWITPMILMNHVDTVVWACGYWCDQFAPGTYKLLVGKDKNDGCIKVGCHGNKNLQCLEYWESGDTTCNVEDFEYYREWTFITVRYGKNCRLPDKQWHKLCDEFKTGPWVLDIDEDFFSCNNPYFDEFRDLFGEKMHTVVKRMYETNVGEETNVMEELLMSLFRNKSYKKCWSYFKKTKLAKKMLESMSCPKKITVLKQFHTFLRKNWPNGGMDESDSEEDEDEPNCGWDVRDFFTLDDLHRTGQLACLPHHISSAKEIKDLVNEVDALLDTLPRPGIVTVATSRLDRYLPDSQAATIHGFLEAMLTNRYETESVVRLDRTKFSVDCGVSAEELDEVGAKFVTDILEPEPAAE